MLGPIAGPITARAGQSRSQCPPARGNTGLARFVARSHQASGHRTLRRRTSPPYGVAAQFQVCHAVPVAGLILLPSRFHMLVNHTTPVEAAVEAAGSGVADA